MEVRVGRDRTYSVVGKDGFLLIVGTALLLTTGLALLASGCTPEGVPREAFRAELTPLNTVITGLETTGTVNLSVTAESLHIAVEVQNAPADMMHLIHYHGFVDGRGAVCPTPEVDVNGDGIIDLIETHAVSGRTMVPFHGDPATLQIQAGSYPTADAEGNLSYQRSVALADLAESLREKWGVDSLQFAKRVVYLHGVDPERALPETVQSLEGVDPHITLPIACGKLVLVGP